LSSGANWQKPKAQTEKGFKERGQQLVVGLLLKPNANPWPTEIPWQKNGVSQLNDEPLAAQNQAGNVYRFAYRMLAWLR